LNSLMMFCGLPSWNLVSSIRYPTNASCSIWAPESAIMIEQ
jgi:hypothetical protein